MGIAAIVVAVVFLDLGLLYFEMCEMEIKLSHERALAVLNSASRNVGQDHA